MIISLLDVGRWMLNVERSLPVLPCARMPQVELAPCSVAGTPSDQSAGLRDPLASLFLKRGDR
jgi:hypothetical protein